MGKIKYTEPKGYFNADMKKAFNDASKKSKKTTSKKTTSKKK